MSMKHRFPDGFDSFEFGEIEGSRLRDLATIAAGSLWVGFTQPRTHNFAQTLFQKFLLISQFLVANVNVSRILHLVAPS